MGKYGRCSPRPGRRSERGGSGAGVAAREAAGEEAVRRGADDECEVFGAGPVGRRPAPVMISSAAALGAAASACSGEGASMAGATPSGAPRPPVSAAMGRHRASSTGSARTKRSTVPRAERGAGRSDSAAADWYRRRGGWFRRRWATAPKRISPLRAASGRGTGPRAGYGSGASPRTGRTASRGSPSHRPRARGPGAPAADRPSARRWAGTSPQG